MAVRTQRLPTAGRDVDRPGRLHAAWGAWRGQPVGLAGSLILLAFAALPLLYAGLRLTVWQHQRYDPVVGFDSQTEPNPAPPSWIPADWLAEDDVHRHDGNRPSWQHLLGTDTLGRDILSVLMASSVASFIVGLSAAVMTALLGLLLASLAAYHGGWIDTAITQVADAFLLIPAPIFMIAVGSYLRSRRATFLALLLSGSSGLTLTPWQEAILQPLEFGLAYGLVAGAGGATLVIRAQALKVMNKSFIAAAQVAGAGRRQIIGHHLWPHLAPLAAIYMMATTTGAIVADGFLAFLGFSPTLLNWGTMIYYGFAYRVVNFTIPWNALLAPGVAISLFAAAFYMVSRGLHELMAPEAGSPRPGLTTSNPGA